MKPNAREPTRLTGLAEPSRAAQEARRRGALAVVASSGAAGLPAVTEGGSWRACGDDRLEFAWRSSAPAA